MWDKLLLFTVLRIGHKLDTAIAWWLWGELTLLFLGISLPFAVAIFKDMLGGQWLYYLAILWVAIVPSVIPLTLVLAGLLSLNERADELIEVTINRIR